MSQIIEAISFTEINSAFQLASGSNLLQYIVGPAIAVGVLALEVSRRTAKVAEQDAPHTEIRNGTSVKNKYLRYVPEIMGLVGCLALAVILRVHGAVQTQFDSELQENVVTKIHNAWPMLISADSLLAVQAMLRLVVLVSTVMRSGDGPTLLSQEVTAIFCGAAVGRTFLVARSSTYMLDGPLGGLFPAACDLLSVPLLAFLSRGIQRKSLAASALALVAAACIGSGTSLKLTDDALANGLFFFVHSAEIFAAFAYLALAVRSEVELVTISRKSVASWFANIVMPFQACLSAYFFVEAFRTVPGLVGGGYPFEILHIGGVAQVAAYACACMIHFVSEPTENEQEQYLITEV